MARRLLVAVMAGGWAAAGFIGALVASTTGAPVTACFAAWLVMGMLIFRAPVRASAGPRAPLALSIGAALVSPFAFLGASWALSNPIVSSHFRCGTGDAALIIFAPFVLAAWSAIAVLLGFAIVGTHERRAIDVLLRAFAATATVAGIALVSLAMLRAKNKPEPDRWLSTLPVATDLATLAWQPAAADGPEGKNVVHQASFAGRTLSRSCTPEGYCSVRFLGADNAIGVGKVGDRVELLEAGGFYVLRSTYPEGAFDAQGAKADIGVRTIAPQLSAPRGFIASGGFAMLVAAIAILVAATRRSTDVRGLRDGVVDAEGHILLDDGTRWPSPAAWQEGTRVIARPSVGATTFRADAGPEFTLGTIDGLRGEARIASATWSAFALATAMLGVAPLVAAVVYRIAV